MTKVAELYLGQPVLNMDKEIPDSDEAKLKFYLQCVSKLIFIDDDLPVLCRGNKLLTRRSAIKEMLTDYKSKTALERNGCLEALLVGCTKYCPGYLKDKVIFYNESFCGDFQAKMIQLSDTGHIGLSLSGYASIYGERKEVYNILVCKKEWVEKYWEKPMKNYMHIMSE